MKKAFLLLIFFLISAFAKGQNINDRLYKAIINKDTSQVEQLLSGGADANYKPKMGQAEIVLLTVAVTNNDFKSVKLLVEHKAKIDARDWFNSTPLMYAANTGTMAIINYLLQNGADVKANDGQGNTVLSAAKEKNNAAVIKLIEDRLKQK